MTALIAAAVAVFVIAVAIAVYRSHYGIGDVRIRFQTEAGTIIRTGHGESLGAAVADGIAKLYDSLSPSSQKETIESRLKIMQSTLSEYRGWMFRRHIEASERYIVLTQELLHRKNEQEQAQERAKAEEKRKQQELAEEKCQQRREREREKARLRAVREKNLPAQRRFVQEQRRLMTDKLRYKVMARDGFRCQICGATQADGYKLHVDHIYPVSKGGKTEMDNLRTLCERCNMGKGAEIEKMPFVTAQGFGTDSETPYDTAMLLLHNRKLEYVDKTASGGGLYFFDKEVARELKEHGFTVGFASNGTKGTEHRAAWFIK